MKLERSPASRHHVKHLHRLLVHKAHRYLDGLQRAGWGGQNWRKGGTMDEFEWTIVEIVWLQQLTSTYN